MPRRIRRRIRGNFKNICFKPCGVPVHDLETVSLSKDELEAVRLADLEGLYQEDAANKMEVSRPTFGRILNSARNKIADAIINGKTIELI
jgi:predicted DNA-binding protein (UPF0251 family)